MTYQKLFSKTSFALTTALLSIAACKTPAPTIAPDVRLQAVADMTPAYECILYHEQTENKEAVTASIDTAVTIGEGYGLPPGDFMSIYRGIRTEQEEKVLNKALELATKRDGVLPRISGKPIPPTRDEELAAWEELYGEGCAQT